jgi:hypothetical protein
VLVIQGIVNEDLLNLSHNNKFVKDKFTLHKGTLSYDVLNVPRSFKDNYLKIINLRDIIASSSSEIGEEVNKKYI